MQITLQLELTPENLDKLKTFCTDTQAAAVPEKAPAKKTTTKKADKPVESPAPTESKATAENETAPAAAEETTPAPTKTDVRAVALKLSKAGKSAMLKEIFAKFGAEKLSDIKEDQYPELMKELTAVG